jgi:DNA-binding CsgD family transcriptional regulator
MARRISSPVLVGRDAEIRALELALEDARSARRGLIVMSGEAGAGKSRLVGEFAARARDRGGLAVVGTAPVPAGRVRLPYAALTQALRGLVRSIDARLLDAVLGAAREDLASLLPELGSAPAPSVDDPFGGARLPEAMLVTFEAVAARRAPLMIALEDLHWADAATLATTTFLCGSLVDAPVVLVLTYRSEALHAEDDLAAFLAGIGRLADVERLDLALLGRADVERQVRAILGSDPEAELITAVARRSGGNPFFVEELLLAVAEGGGDRPPPSVRTMVDARMARLGEPSRRLVETAAVAGSEATAELLAAVTGLPPDVLDGALREARKHHLLAAPEQGDEADEPVEFRHVLVREVIGGRVSAPLRRRIHAKAAAAIRTDPRLAGPSGLERWAALAGHLLLAGDAAGALPALLGEAAAAEAARAFETAHRAYRQALETWRTIGAEPLPDVPARGDVLERAALAASLAGHPGDAVALAEEALSAAPASDRRDGERDTRLRMHLGRYLSEAGWHEAAVASARLALDGSPPGSLIRSRCGIELARRLVGARLDDEAVRHAADAGLLARALRARREIAQARSIEALALARLGRTGEALAALAEVPLTARAPGRTSRRTRPSRLPSALRAYLERAGVLEHAGDLAGAVELALEGHTEAERAGLRTTLGSVLAATAARDLIFTGRFDGAAELLADGEPERPGLPHAHLVRALLAARRGEWGVVERQLDAAGDVPPSSELPGWAALAAQARGEMHRWRRHHSLARAAILEGIVAAGRESETETVAALALLGLRVEADAAETATRRGSADRVLAEEAATGWWLRLAAAVKGHGPDAPRPPRLAALAVSGDAELARITHPGDPRPWARSVEAWDDAGDPYEAACASWRLAEAHLMGEGDRAGARESLGRALEVAERLAARPLAQEVGELARRARFALRMDDQALARGTLSAAHAEARRLGLSDREVEVLELLGEGLSDRQIGQRLFITTKTAGHHVSHILTKLGAARRGEAVAIAFRIGLVRDRPGP